MGRFLTPRLLSDSFVTSPLQPQRHTCQLHINNASISNQTANFLPFNSSFSLQQRLERTHKDTESFLSSEEILLMALSGLSSTSKKSPDHSSSKLKKKKALEFKKKMWSKKPTVLNRKPTSLTYKTKKVESESPKKSTICYERKAEKTSRSRGCVEQNSSAMSRALDVQENLSSTFPSFVKLMLRSHVTGGFWLGLPKPFCDRHLPRHDETVVLVGENEGEYITKYLAEKNGLSAGWRGFSITHKLLEGDVLVFQLIEACKFKVYIVRANGLAEIDGAISLLNLDLGAKPIDQIGPKMETCETGEKEYLESNRPDHHQEKVMVLEANNELRLHQSENDTDDFALEVLEGIRFSQSALDFKDVKNFEDFKILVDGLIIDSEVPAHIRHQYYELCCSQKSFIHDHLVEGLNCKLAAGIISETVNIADAIRAAKLTTSRDYLQTWDKTLKAFEDLGMGVGFLRERLNKLASISCEQQKEIESKTAEHTQLEEEIRAIVSKLQNVEAALKRIDAEIEALKVDGKRFELTFREVAVAQW